MRSRWETRCESGEWRGRAGAGRARRDEAGESEGGISTERLLKISGFRFLKLGGKLSWMYVLMMRYTPSQV